MAVVNKRSIHFKAIYQEYDWCYQKFIIEGLNHDQMAEEANCTKRVIEKWCCEKHRLTQKYRQKNKQLSGIQIDLIVGSMLGDGHIDKRETQPIFIVSHAENQKDYLYWKYEILKDLCNIPPTYQDGGKVKFKGNPKEYTKQGSHRICTRVYDSLLPFREMGRRELMDSLNAFSLSVWLLDDGHRSRSNWSICIASFSEEEKKHVIKTLKSKFSLNSYILESDNRYLNFRARESRILDNIVLGIMPNDLDIIEYKITKNDNIGSPEKRAYIEIEGRDILLTDYCQINNLPYKSTWSKYKDDIKLVI